MHKNEFIAIVKRSSQRIYLIALSYTKSSSDAEDIMQNVYMKLWKRSKTFENDEHIDKWLTIVCINESRDYIKNPFRKRNMPIDGAINISACDEKGYIHISDSD